MLSKQLCLHCHLHHFLIKAPSKFMSRNCTPVPETTESFTLQMVQEWHATNMGRQKDHACLYDLKLWFKCFYKDKQDRAANVISEIMVLLMIGLHSLT